MNDIISTSGGYTTTTKIYQSNVASESVLLHVSGGVHWVFDIRRSFIPLWTSLGINVADFEYTEQFKTKGMPAKFRLSSHRQSMLEQTVEQLSTQYANIYVIGHSFGGLEAGYISKYGNSKVKKVIISNGVWKADTTSENILIRNAEIEEFDRPIIPTLILHHKDDQTHLCPFSIASEKMKTCDGIVVTGGYPHTGRLPLDPGPHYYTGQEYPVFKEVFNWLNDKSHRSIID